MMKTSSGETIFDHEGCLRGVVMFGILILVLVAVMVLVLYLRPQNLLRYGMVTSLNKIEAQIGLERTLPDEQYQELKVYISSAKKFINETDLDRAAVGRVAPINEMFKSALKDGRISREELADIRSVMWRANIPLDIPEKKTPKK